ITAHQRSPHDQAEKISFSYDEKGKLTSYQRWGDSHHFTRYSSERDPQSGHLLNTIRNEGGKLLYREEIGHDERGLPTQHISFPHDERQVVATASYDQEGHLLEYQKGKGRWNLSLDKAGRRSTLTDPYGSSTTTSYTAWGLPLSQQTQDREGNLLRHQEWQYDGKGQCIKESLGSFSLLHAESGGKQTTSWQGKSPGYLWGEYGSARIYQSIEGDHCERPPFTAGITAYRNDQGKVEKITYQESPRGPLSTLHITHTSGQPSKEEYPHFTLERKEGLHGRILEETIHDAWGEYTLKMTYDGEGRLIHLLLPDQSAITYCYEGPFVTSITREGPHGESLSHALTARDLMGNPLEEKLPGILGRQRRTYNEEGLPVGIHSEHHHHEQSYDLIGRPYPSNRPALTYDALSQVTAEGETLYRYDMAGNLLQKGDLPCESSPCHQLLRMGEATCRYDERGNLTSLQQGGESLDMRWDALGRLILAETPSGETLRYRYDIDHRRIHRESLEEEETERFFYLGDRELGSIDRTGNLLTLRVPLDPHSMGSSPALIELSGTPYVPMSDLQGNVTGLLDPHSGEILEEYTLSVFGEDMQPQAWKNPWRFQGEWHDPQTGLISYRHRHYSPLLCRWISPDPAGAIDSLNLYLFCQNNPLLYRDPYGLIAERRPPHVPYFSFDEKDDSFYWYDEEDDDEDDDDDEEFIRYDLGCPCRFHNHPSYQHRPPGCLCICNYPQEFQKLFAHTLHPPSPVSLWQHPAFQGALQALGGLGEVLIGGTTSLTSGGIATPVGMLLLAHGLDHFIAGCQTIRGTPQQTLTHHLLTQGGLSPSAATAVDTGISIAGGVSATAILRNAHITQSALRTLTKPQPLPLSPARQQPLLLPSLPAHTLHTPKPYPALKKEESQVYQDALRHKRHEKTVEKYLKKTERELKKGIRSFEKQIVKHQQKMANPQQFYPKWDTLHPERRKSSLEKWPKEILGFEEQQKLFQAILDEREQHALKNKGHP
ncbi:MAG: RHS repeat-associated core domain-containing protein, partial [Chlamydiota bacterium]|nr:RHS repeat-associated core domain-containing protein [Chlamydiota bacterium]